MVSSNLKYSFSIYGRTDVGTCRHVNEDYFLIANVSADEALIPELSHFQTFTDQEVLLGVADGSSFDSGATSDSQMALRMLNQIISREHDLTNVPTKLEAAIEQVNTDIHQLSISSDECHGATTICVAFLNEDEAHLAHVGDSRIYLSRRGELYQLTTDHTLIETLIRQGQVSKEEELTHPYRHVILQVLGAQPHVDVELSSLHLKRRDRLLLCTDGLWRLVGDEEIRRVLNDASHVTDIGDQLIDLAYRAGVLDNITVIVAECSGYGLSEPSETEPLSDTLIERKNTLANRNSENKPTP